MYVCVTASELRSEHVVFLGAIHVQIDVRNARLVHDFYHDLMYVCMYVSIYMHAFSVNICTYSISNLSIGVQPVHALVREDGIGVYKGFHSALRR